jgi:hypothetical protein
MATFTKLILSGSTDGMPIPVAATAIGSGTLIHTALDGVTGKDEVFLWVANIDTVARQLTLGWGGTSDAALKYKAVSIPPKTRVPIIRGALIRNALLIKAACDTTLVLNIDGYVHRIQ